ncbi:Box C/D snoRNA accumulation [Savitreella phatthalungensis]
MVEIEETPITLTASPGLSDESAGEDGDERVSKRQKTTCTVCGEDGGRYKCPRCSTVSCSLSCVRAHKSVDGCSGVRDRTSFVSKSAYTQAHFDSDYNFLTAVERTVDNALRHNHTTTHRGRGNPTHQAERHRAAWIRRCGDDAGVTVVPVPSGLGRRKMNRSGWAGKQGCLRWTVEWVFVGSATEDKPITVVSASLLETTVLAQALSPLLKQPHISAVLPTNRQPTLAIKHHPHPDADLLALTQEHTLAQALRGITVHEFPTIYVYATAPADLVSINPPPAEELGVPQSSIDAVLASIAEVHDNGPPQEQRTQTTPPTQVDTGRAGLGPDFISLGMYDSESGGESADEGEVTQEGDSQTGESLGAEASVSLFGLQAGTPGKGDA